MTARLSLPSRMGLIVVVALLAGWLALVAASYMINGLGQSAALPTPARLLALAEIMERAGPAERDRILAAVRTPQLAVWVVPKPLQASAIPEFWPLDAARLDGFREAFADRALIMMPQERGHPLSGFVASALNAVEFRIGLAGDETLVVRSESPYVVAVIGLPVGFGAGLIGVLIALAALILLHREFRPLARLAAAVDRVDPSGEPVDLPRIRARSPELRALVAAFDRLQGRVATLLRARMALIGGIQHDLRTFATRLRLRVDKIADAEDRARAADDIDNMIALLDDALLASRAGASELDEELVDLAALVATEVSDRQAAGAPIGPLAGPAASEGGEAAEATILGDRLALRRIVANLVDNALRYGHRAHLGVRLDGADAILIVDDEGPGIPPDQREVLLEPFTRAETSRARRTGGAGLGLAVVRSLAEAHGGSVSIGQAPGGGARVSVRLPLFSPAMGQAGRAQR